MTSSGGPARLIAAVVGEKPTAGRKPRPAPTPLVAPQSVRCRVPGCGGEYEMTQDRTFGRIFESCPSCERRVNEVRQLRELVDRLKVAVANLKAPPRAGESATRICPRCRVAELPKHKKLCADCRPLAAVESERRNIDKRALGVVRKRLPFNDRSCDRCHRPFTPTSPTQKRHAGACPEEAS